MLQVLGDPTTLWTLNALSLFKMGIGAGKKKAKEWVWGLDAFNRSN